jgi:hypothetical protein
MTNRPHRLLGVAIATALAVAACATNGAAEDSTTQAPATTAAPTTTEAPTTTLAPTTTHTHEPAVDQAGLDAQIGLYTAMRDLWTDHMQWTRSTVDAFFNNQDALEAQLDRLLANQADIGAAIVPFYGQGAGDQLTALLTTHIEQAVPVLTAARDGDSVALDTALADWYANAEEIASFLSAANPDHWPTSATQPMMKGHIDTTVVYATDLLNADYAAAIEHFDEANDHMMMLADTLAAGIIAQFPDQFAG